MGIKERNLPIAESLGSGDKLRIVTSEGESKQIGADSVGGGRDRSHPNRYNIWRV